MKVMGMAVLAAAALFAACGGGAVQAKATTALRYELDFEEALARGAIDEVQAADKDGLLRQITAILEKRVAPAGTAVRVEGERRVVVELAAGADVAATRWRIERRGGLQFLIRARAADFAAAGTNEPAERSRVLAWLADGSGADLADYNRLPREQGGPPERMRWHFHRDDGKSALESRLQPLMLPQDEAWRFTERDLRSISPARDGLDYPAVAFELSEDRSEAFEDFTAANVHEPLAIVFDGVIVVMPVINAPLPGKGVISGGLGGFQDREVGDLVAILRGGELPVVPEFLEAVDLTGSEGAK